MGIFDIFKDVAKAGIDIVKTPYNILTNQSGKDQQKLMNEQIKAYREQSALAKDELARAKDEKSAEKRRINEKQIRALRGKSSSRGFLGSSNPDAMNPAMSSRLGD